MSCSRDVLCKIRNFNFNECTVYRSYQTWLIRCELFSATDGSGTTAELGRNKHLTAGNYRLHFETSLYFQQLGTRTIYPHIDVRVTRSFLGSVGSYCTSWSVCSHVCMLVCLCYQDIKLQNGF